MRINQSIFSWALSVWLCFVLMLQSSHGIDLLIQEVAHSSHKEQKHESTTHHDENCSICHFHLSPSLLPTFTFIDSFAVDISHSIKDTYHQGISFYSNEYVSLRAPPFKVC